MGMRAVALVLVLSLVSPAVITAACELSCLQAAHHAATTAGANCHGDEANSGGPAFAAGGTLCHDDDGDAPAATAALGTQTAPPPAIVPASLVVAAPPAAPHAARPPHTLRPPDPRQTLTPLRI